MVFFNSQRERYAFMHDDEDWGGATSQDTFDYDVDEENQQHADNISDEDKTQQEVVVDDNQSITDGRVSPVWLLQTGFHECVNNVTKVMRASGKCGKEVSPNSRRRERRKRRKLLIICAMLLVISLLIVVIAVPVTLFAKARIKSAHLDDTSSTVPSDGDIDEGASPEKEEIVLDDIPTAATPANTNSNESSGLRPSPSNTEANIDQDTGEVIHNNSFDHISTVIPATDNIETSVLMPSPVNTGEEETINDISSGISSEATTPNVETNEPSETSELMPSPANTESNLNQNIGQEETINDISSGISSWATTPNLETNESSDYMTSAANIGNVNDSNSMNVITTVASQINDSEFNPDNGEEVAYYEAVHGMTTVSAGSNGGTDQDTVVDNVMVENSINSISAAAPSSINQERETLWLQAHNTRRKEWHEREGETYVPLRWSDGLASHALTWARKLLDQEHENFELNHDHDTDEGENLARNCGTGSWGEMYHPDDVLSRWVEREIDLNPPDNLHLTQVLWRPTKYVGCADAMREYNDGTICHVQVCRYVKTGNCNFGKYEKTEWMVPMLLDDSGCGNECPPEGCF